ncbi:MAG: hypothetical protein ACTSPY_16050 [Candidatus Helarchaeota archaeon]
MSYGETHPKKATAYLLMGLIFEIIVPILAYIYMDQIIAFIASFIGIPPFSLGVSSLMLIYIVVFGLAFSFIAFGRGFYTKHSRKYAIWDCIGSIFALAGYIVIVGFFSGLNFGHIYFSMSGFSIDINIYLIYTITIILYLLTFIIKFAAIAEADH